MCPDSDKKSATMVLLQSKPNGQMDCVFKLEKYTEWIKDNLKEVPRQNKEFFEADKICENFSMDEQLRLQNSKIA